MSNNGFKIGDKVKLKDHVSFTCKGKVLTITKEAGDDYSRYLHVVYEGILWNYFPLLPNEIEPTVAVGEQLMFQFMKED